MAPTIFSSLLKFFSICSAQSTISYQLFYRMWKSETYRKSSLFFIPDTFVTWSNPTKILRHWPFQYLQCNNFCIKTQLSVVVSPWCSSVAANTAVICVILGKRKVVYRHHQQPVACNSPASSKTKQKKKIQWKPHTHRVVGSYGSPKVHPFLF